jgi:hypothetical protein
VLYQLSYGPNPERPPAASYEILRTADNSELRTIRFREPIRFMLKGWLTGIEPATPGATDRCSNQLSYSHHRTALHLNPVRQSNQPRFSSSSYNYCIAHGQSTNVLLREYARSGGAPNCAPSPCSVAGLLVAR